MERKGFPKRFLGPVFFVFVVMSLSWAAYMLSPRVPSFALFQIVAIVSGIVLFISLGLGALYVYYVSYVRGAGFAERVIAALVNPLIWMTKEVAVLGSIYTVPEALYYYLNPVHLLLIGAVAAEMGAAELLVRRKLRGCRLRTTGYYGSGGGGRRPRHFLDCLHVPLGPRCPSFLYLPGRL